MKIFDLCKFSSAKELERDEVSISANFYVTLVRLAQGSINSSKPRKPVMLKANKTQISLIVRWVIAQHIHSLLITFSKATWLNKTNKLKKYIYYERMKRGNSKRIEERAAQTVKKRKYFNRVIELPALEK